VSLTTCTACGGENVTYQAFSGGREFYCRDCESAHPYPEELLPPRLKLLREGRIDELRAQLRAEMLPPGDLVEVDGVPAITAFYRWAQGDDGAVAP